jgi:hypothetical protein
VLEIVSDSLDPSAGVKPIPSLAKGEEATGMRRVIEALECNSWANAVRHNPPSEPKIPRLPETSKAPEDTKQPGVPLKEAKQQSQAPESSSKGKEEEKEKEEEDEAEEFEKLMEEMMRVKSM